MTHAKRYSIQVRKYADGLNHYHAVDFTLLNTIERVLRAEQIGNFNPLFCTYKGKRTLVHSDDGDLSDPFRRTDEYAQTLFIEA
jgi:hypothetical protein